MSEPTLTPYMVTSEEWQAVQSRIRRLSMLTLCSPPREPWPPGLNDPKRVEHDPWPENYRNMLFICEGCRRTRDGYDGPFPEWRGRRLCHQCLPVAAHETVCEQERRIEDLEFKLDQLLLYGRKRVWHDTACRCPR